MDLLFMRVFETGTCASMRPGETWVIVSCKGAKEGDQGRGPRKGVRRKDER